jgi:small subunit ribosomal protein S20
MANHKSAEKRIRQTETRRLRNRYKTTKMKVVIKDLRKTTDRAAAEQKLPQVYKVIDKVAKSRIIHKNKAANLKSKLAKFVNHLS